MKLTEENRELKELVETYKNIAERAVSLLDETNTKVQQKMKGKKPKNIYETFDKRDNNNLQNKNRNQQNNLRKNNMKNIVNKRKDIISTHSNNNIISTNSNNIK